MKVVMPYHFSFELDNKQSNVCLKIGSLLMSLDSSMEECCHWAEQVEKLNAGHEIASQLRKAGSQHVNGILDMSQDRESSLRSRIDDHPDDADAHIELVKFFLARKSTDAFKQILESFKANHLLNSVTWCKYLLDTFAENTQWESEYWYPFIHLWVINRLVMFSFNDTNNIDTNAILLCFDQALQAQFSLAGRDILSKIMFSEISAQLLFHCSLHMMKRNTTSHRESSIFSLSLMLFSFQTSVPEIHTPERASDHTLIWKQRFYNASCYRLSVSGHYLLSKSLLTGSEFSGTFDSEDKRKKLYQSLFSVAASSLRSFILENTTWIVSALNMPDATDIHAYDNEACLWRPWDLSFIGWLSVKYMHLDEDFLIHDLKAFNSLKFNCSDVYNMSIETLCILDLQAFLFASIFCVSDDQTQEQLLLSMASSSMFSELQLNWWQTACDFTTGKKRASQFKDLLLGIRAVRLSENGINVSLVVHLAESFQQMVGCVMDSTGNKKIEIEKRASFYWEKAIQLLLKLKNGQSAMQKPSIFFPTDDPEWPANQIDNILDDGNFNIACYHMHIGKLEEALEFFEQSNKPYSYYYQAKIYVDLAGKVDLSGEPVSDRRAQQVAFLQKARDSIYQALDKITGDKMHKLNNLLSVDLESIETKLSKLNIGSYLDDDDSSQSSDEGEPKYYIDRAGTPPKMSGVVDDEDVYLYDERSRMHVPPSPERLDAQYRNLLYETTLTQKMFGNHVKKQSDVMSQLVEEIRLLRKSVDKIAESPLSLLGGQQQDQHPIRLDQNVVVGGEFPAQPVPIVTQASGFAPQQQFYTFNAAPYNQGFAFPQTSYPPPPQAGYPPPMHVPVQMDPFSFAPLDQQVPTAPQPTLPVDNDERTRRHTVEHFPAASQPVDLSVFAGLSDIANLSDASIDKGVSSRNRNQSVGSEGAGNISADFTPIVTLPEVVTSTGEEGEKILFESRAKLFRFIDGEWKERGLGQLKILQDTSSMKARIVMRREQVNTLCANHNLKPDMELTAAPNKDTAWIWMAIDFADGERTPEKFCVRFKTPDLAQAFHSSFNNAKLHGSPTKGLSKTPEKSKPESSAQPFTVSPKVSPIKSPDKAVSFSADVATGSPEKTTEQTHYRIFGEQKMGDETIANLFGGGSSKFEFKIKSPEKAESSPARGDRNESTSSVEDYDPHYEPIVSLPKLVERVTGEEDEGVLFCERAKLYRFDSTTHEWKERGLGDLKILHSAKTNKCRLLMRREQILKLCANHYILPDMNLDVMGKAKNSWCWHADDFSEEEVTHEKFAVRFKTEEIADKFQTEFDKCKTIAASSPKADKADAAPTPSFGQMFQKPSGSWECEFCLVQNKPDATTCAACSGRKPGTAPVESKPEGSKPGAPPTFQFNIQRGSSKKDQNQTLPPAFHFSAVKSTDPNASLPSATATSSKDPKPPPFKFDLGALSSTPKSVSDTSSAAASQKESSDAPKPANTTPEIFGTPQAAMPQSAASSIFGTPKGSNVSAPSSVFGSPKVNSSEPPKPASLFGSPKTNAKSDSSPASIFGSQNNGSSTAATSIFGSKPVATPVFGQQKDNASDKSSGSSIFGTPTFKPSGGIFGSLSKPATNIFGSAASANPFASVKKEPTPADSETDSDIEIVYVKLATDEEIARARKYILPDNFFLIDEDKEPCPGCSECPSDDEDDYYGEYDGEYYEDDEDYEDVEEDEEEEGEVNVDDDAPYSPPPSPETSQKPFSFGAGSSGATNGLSFAALAQSSVDSEGFASKAQLAGEFHFESGAALFSNADKKDSYEGDDDAQEPTFEPVIPLPELVDVVTGEENEEVLFAERAKLYRWDNEQWKERGVGQFKVLKNNETGKFRFLHRREQVLKLGCNHYITDEIKLQPMSTTENALCWFAYDYSDPESPDHHKFAVKFKTRDLASEFENVVSSAQAEMKESEQ